MRPLPGTNILVNVTIFQPFHTHASGNFKDLAKTNLPYFDLMAFRSSPQRADGLGPGLTVIKIPEIGLFDPYPVKGSSKEQLLSDSALP